MIKKSSSFYTLCFSVLILATSLSSQLVFAEEECTVIGVTTKSRLLQCSRVKILQLKGSPQERGEALAYWIKSKKISTKLWEDFQNQISGPSSEDKPGRVSFMTSWVFNFLFRGEIERAVSETQEMKVMVKKLGMSWSEYERTFAIADLGALIPSLSKSIPLVLLQNIGFLGCTSIMTIEKNQFFHGRNLDYSLVGTYDKNPLIVVRYPEDKEHLKTVSFTSDGFFMPSITGMNEKGITYSLHQTYTNVGTSRGLPVLSIGQKVLSQAHNLEEAIELLRENPSGTFWKVILSDLNTGKVVYIYMSKNVFEVFKRDKPESFALTNHFFDKKMKIFQQSTIGGLHNSMFRKNKAEELLKKSKGSMSVKKIAQILGYQKNPKRPDLHNNIGSFGTVQTVLWKSNLLNSKKKEVYLSQGLTPTAQGEFVRFDFNSLFQKYGKNPSFDMTRFFDKKRHERNSQLALFYNQNTKLLTQINQETDLDHKKKLIKKSQKMNEGINENIISPFYLAYKFYTEESYKKMNSVFRKIKNENYFYADYIKEYLSLLKELSLFQQNKNYTSLKFFKASAFSDSVSKQSFKENLKKNQKLCDPFLKNKNLSGLSKKLRVSTFSGSMELGFYTLDELKNCR